MTMDTRAVLDAFWEKTANQDLTIVDLFADEIELYLPGNPKHFPWAGLYRQGGKHLIDHYKAVWGSRQHGTRSEGTVQVIVEGEHAAWFGTDISYVMNETSKSPGKRFFLDAAMHFRVVNGKIVRLYVIEDMTALAREYGYTD